MSTTLTTLVHAPEADRVAAAQAAAEALRAGSLVVLPTETVYGLACSARSEPALARLAAATGAEGPIHSTWHCHRAEDALRVLPITHPAHRRLVRTLTPGPVRFLIEMHEGHLARVVRELGVRPGALDDGRQVALRVPDQPLTRRVLELAGEPIVAHGLAAAGWGDGRRVDEGLPADGGASAGVAVVLDDGPARLGTPSTTVRLGEDGGVEVLHEGSYDARAIERVIRLRLLFVCTGNTCRSPMAEAIARAVGEELAPEGLTIEAESAGVSASEGAPATPEGLAALRELGIESPRHRSRRLTRAMLERADAVFALTRAHLDAIAAVDPAAARRARLLDPGGGDVPDPIGGSAETYRQTARHIATLVRRRLDEMLSAEKGA